MSRKRARAISPGPTSKQAAPVLAADYNGRKIVLPRNADYHETVGFIKRAFKSLSKTPACRIVLSARFEGHDDLLEIPEEIWANMLPQLKLVQASLDDEPHTWEDNVPTLEPEGTINAMGSKILVKLEKIAPDSDTKFVNVSISRTRKIINSLSQIAHAQLGMPPDGHSFFFNGTRITHNDSFADMDVEDGETITVMGKLIGGKPVIYLLPPADIHDISVNLFLCASWSFSDIYPPTPIQSNNLAPFEEKVTWVVDAKPDGTLHDHKTQGEVAYLFWEAHTEPRAPITPACSRPGTLSETLALEFDPSHAIVEPENSVLLPFHKVTSHIDDALITLGLHTEARTSFITYWLPKLSQHGFIALRFLPQAAYEAAARLDIAPTPDVTTRVFMLFRGVGQSAINLWESARVRAERGVGVWLEIVGVDLDTRQLTQLCSEYWSGVG